MKSMPFLPPRQALFDSMAHVWLACPDDCVNTVLVERYQSLFDDEERRRLEAFRFAEDRHLYLVAHALLRTTLSRYHDIAPRSWRFTAGEFGRPEIAHGCGIDQPLTFNLSHTPGLAACGVTSRADIGVDVECLNRTVDELALAERYFSRHETQALRQLPLGRRHLRFREYWTLKEAYVKACGNGLSMPLDAFYFTQDASGTWRISFENETGNPADWLFLCQRPTPQHVLAVAIHHVQRDLEIEIYKTVPMLQDSELLTARVSNGMRGGQAAGG